MNWEFTAPKKSGEIIRTKVSFYYHYGIFVSEEEIIQFGLPNDPGKQSDQIKAVISNISTFLNGGEIETARPSKQELLKMRSNEDIVQFARSKIGSGGYDILHNNCEHFVNECAFGKSDSTFLDNLRKTIRKKINTKK